MRQNLERWELMGVVVNREVFAPVLPLSDL